MGKRSYADILRLYNKAWSLREKGLRKLGEDREHASTMLFKALVELLRALALYAGRSLYGVGDPVYLASILLDEGFIDAETYSMIVEVEVNQGRDIELLLRVIEKIDEKIRRLDPYIGGQSRLFRY